MSSRGRRLIVAAMLLVPTTGCTVSAAVDAARARDIPRLDRALRAEQKSGALDRGEAHDVARALAEAEIRAAKGDAGVTLVRSLSPCASALERALDDRLDTGDDVAAAAGGVMLGADLVPNDAYAKFAVKKDSRPMFRALGARSLVDDTDYVPIRLPLFRDLDERVRLSALSAAEDFAIVSDYAALADAARLDPLPEARDAAARAMGVIGGETAVRDLRDLWTNADTGLRRSVAIAWGYPKTFAAGGETELVWAAENDAGEGALAAALQLAKPNVPASADDRAIALGVLVRAIKLGTRESRIAIISAAPSEPEVLDAVRVASDDSDPGIAVAAWTRLYADGTKSEQSRAKEKLYEHAKADGIEALLAREVLAFASDKRVEPLLNTSLTASSAATRAGGARGFVALGESQRAALLLADKDGSFRLEVACAMLARPHG